MAEARVEQAAVNEAMRALHRQELGRVVVALGDATSLEELMSIVASPEYERWEGTHEVEVAEAAARDRLLAEDEVDVYSVPLDDAKLWRERYEMLRAECERLVKATGHNSVDFYRSLARVRGLVSE
jgi:hypothetical protein